MRHTILSILTITLLLLTACRQQKTAYTGPQRQIVVLQPMEELAQIFQTMRDSFSAEFADTNRYALHYYWADEQSWHYTGRNEYEHQPFEFIQKKLDKMKADGIRPDLIIIYGDILSHTAAQMHGTVLDSVPIMCMGITHPQHRGLLKARHWVVFEDEPSVKENLDFIRELGFPSWIITTLDSTYLDAHFREVIQQQIGQDTLNYRFDVDLQKPRAICMPAKRDSITTLIPLNLEYPWTNNPDNLPMGFYTNIAMKIEKNTFSFLKMKNDVYANLALNYNIGLYFATTPEYFGLPLINAMASCLGGYFCPWSEMAREAHPVVDSLLAGADPATFTWRHQKHSYWLDWRLARRIHPYAEDFPSYIQFINLPWVEQSRIHERIMHLYGPITISFLLLCVACFLLYIQLRRRRQLRQLQKQGEQAKQIEQRMERTMDAINALYFKVMRDGYVVLQNSVYERFHLRKRPIPLEVMLRLVEPKKHQLLRDAILSTNATRTQSIDAMVALPGLSQLQAVLIQFSPVNLQNTNILRTGIIIENNEAHRIEMERQESFRASEETKVKESFLASMGHEIRNPLNAIVGFADVLASQHDQLSNEERKMMGEQIMNSNEQLLYLLDSVMDNTKNGEKTIKLQLMRKHVDELMENIYQMHTVIVPSHLQFIFNRGPKDLCVMTNRAAMMQVMSNLLNNAIKFTSQGSITLGWELTTQIGEQWVALYVEDTGIGIAEENREKIFSQYFKEDTHSVGAGIGLPLCRSLVLQMNGTIKVLTPKSGRGSRFEIKLKKI